MDVRKLGHAVQCFRPYCAAEAGMRGCENLVMAFSASI